MENIYVQSRVLTQNFECAIFKKISFLHQVESIHVIRMKLSRGRIRKYYRRTHPGGHGLRPKKLSVSVAVSPAPVRVPSRRPLAPSVTTVTSVANDKDDNEINDPGGCAQISWHLPYSCAKPQETSAWRPSNQGDVRPVIASNGVPFFQMRSVGSHRTLGREKEGKEERSGKVR